MPDGMADPRLVDGLQAILLLGMALLAWREFRAIRAKMKADKDRKQQMRDQSSPKD
jgi:hypothetical protein